MNRFPLQPHSPRKSTSVWGLAMAMAFPLALGTAPTARGAEPVAAADTRTATLTVTFQGIKTPSGAVMAALAGDRNAFENKAPPLQASRLEVTGASVTAVFAGLAPGTYAISAFHDLNGDGKLDTNPFGIPTEPYAFSNNARGAMGPPAWAAAAFEVKVGDNRQTIDID